MTLRLNGSTSGYVEIDAPAVAGDNTLTLPSTPNGSLVALDSSGRLGIGDSDPNYTLDVNGNVGIREDNNLIFHDGAGVAAFRIRGTSDNKLFFERASGFEHQMVIDDGKVGIGTTAPTNKLVVASSGVGYEIDQASLGNTNLLLSYDRGASAYRSVANYYGGTFTWNDGGAERARIDSSGRLLVGTSTARTNFYNTTYSSQFQVEGDASATAQISLTSTFAGINGPNLIFGKHRSGSSGGNTIVQDNDELGLLAFMGSDGSEQVAGAYIQASVDGTPGANDMPGRLVFSTTADGASSPTERMRITSLGVPRFFSSDTGIISKVAAVAGTAETLFRGSHTATNVLNGTDCIFIRSNGNVENTNNSYGAISDIKLKENIVDASPQWDDLKALQVRNYNFKEGQTHTQIGLVAQEVELVSPGLVSESPDRDEEGNDLGTVTKSVNYSVLYMKAVKALQEAMERIETLEGMVAVNNITIDEQQHQLSTLAARLTALENA